MKKKKKKGPARDFDSCFAQPLLLHPAPTPCSRTPISHAHGVRKPCHILRRLLPQSDKFPNVIRLHAWPPSVLLVHTVKDGGGTGKNLLSYVCQTLLILRIQNNTFAKFASALNKKKKRCFNKNRKLTRGKGRGQLWAFMTYMYDVVCWYFL